MQALAAPILIYVFLISLWDGVCHGRAVVRDAEPSPITVDAASPTVATDIIDSNFLGFAFEEASLLSYTGTSQQPNQFSLKLINAITSRTNGIPIIRVGGTSGDNAQYNRSQEKAITGNVVGQAAGAARITIGPSFFDYLTIIPDAKYILQVPLVHDDIATFVDFAEDGVKRIGLGNIVAIELGNEPNFYGISEAEYAKKFRAMADAITDRLNLGDVGIFQALDIASGVNLATFSPSEIWRDGIDTKSDIKQIAFHYYQTSGATEASDISALLMNHTAITGKLDPYKPAINWYQNNAPNVKIIMDEVGNSLTTSKDGLSVPVLPFQAVLGSALWAVDFQLYLMVVGFTRVNLQQRDSSGYNLWIPRAIPRYYSDALVQAPFYAQLFVAEFIGSSGNTRIANINLNSAQFAAYGAYENGTLQRVAIINFDFWSESDGERPTRKFVVKAPNASRANVDFLTAPHGALANQTITWANQQWSHDHPEGHVATNSKYSVIVRDGDAEVVVPASAAAIVHFSS